MNNITKTETAYVLYNYKTSSYWNGTTSTPNIYNAMFFDTRNSAEKYLQYDYPLDEELIPIAVNITIII